MEIFNCGNKKALNYLYLYINLGSFIIPFVFSFHPKIQFHKAWRHVLPGIIVSGLFYLSWDVMFTNLGVWGFNDSYLLGFSFLGLPVEEILFFFCIPYACLFTHYSLLKLCPNWRLKANVVNAINSVLVIGGIAILIFYSGKAYTFVNGLCFVLILLLCWWLKPKILRGFYLTFLVVLFPFFVVNGILTGTFIKNEVVWYNDVENLGVRLWTIPVEDVFYAFGMLLLAVLVSVFVGLRVEEKARE